MLKYLTLSIHTTLYKGTVRRLSNFIVINPKPKYLFGQVLFTKLSCSKRLCGNSSTDIIESDSVYQEIYRFPTIRVAYALQKLKWLQTQVTAASVPTSGLLYFSGLIDGAWVFSIIGCGCLFTLNLYGCTKLCNQAVGFMYLSKDGNTLKISYLDYWGKRVDMESPVEDIVPLPDGPRQPRYIPFTNISFYSTDQLKLKLYIRHGQITDRNKFSKVFGNIELY